MTGDTGAVDTALAAALAGDDRTAVLSAFVGARVFATITATATATETGAHGLRQESSAEMAVVLLEGADGSRALPVFSDLAALKRWRLDGRPVPLTGAQACAAALDEGAQAVVLDPAGAAVVVTELAPLAGGALPLTGLSARRGVPELRPPAVPPPAGLVTALRAALAPEGLRSARLLEGPDGLVLGLPVPPAELAALGGRLLARLGDALPPGGLDLAPVPDRGPGHEVLRRGLLRRGR